MGFGNGCTEAACNPMIADMYSGVKMDKMLNRFHMWFPGGIVVGSLISKFMTDFDMSWQAQMWVTMIPTIIYAILFYGKAFPKPHVEGVTSLSKNLRAMLTPTFIFLFVCMSLTAISEFGPQQWVGLIMANSGASPMLILALVTGLMAVGRFFAGPVVKALGQTGVLLGGAIFATIGIYLFSTVTGPMAYVAAVIFAIGVCYFWPTMVGAAAQRVPLSGALGMSIIGGVGMFSTAIWQPVIGGWIDSATAEKAAAGLSGSTLELAAGQDTLAKMVTFPAILIVLFIIFFFWQKNVKPAETPEVAPVH
ncbi:MFS transporter [Anseongella ginsenosidimutans]|uniref:MFS transporter n=1 Tax=Anseongella ginsenosidimutans TaxID=496056 RepID=UPI0021D2F215|nr:MFS transporter [Anseongella ginsenosidimutans]